LNYGNLNRRHHLCFDSHFILNLIRDISLEIAFVPYFFFIWSRVRAKMMVESNRWRMLINAYD